MFFLLLGGRQGPEDVATYPLKDAAKVRTIPDMAKRNFTLPKWQTENQRQKHHVLPHCHENRPSIRTMIGGQSRLKGPFSAMDIPNVESAQKKPTRLAWAFRFGIVFSLYSPVLEAIAVADTTISPCSTKRLNERVILLGSRAIAAL